MIIRAIGHQPVSVEALSELTGASGVTIRRDLADLEGRGLLRRIHGGAVRVHQRGTPMPHHVRAAEEHDLKAAIARVAAALVEPDQSIILDNGTTTVAVAHELRGRPLTALCLSLHTAVVLGTDPACQVVTPGGPLLPDTLAAGAAASIDAIRNVRADLAFIGACAASPTHGLTTTTWEDARIKREMRAAANRVVLLATGTKLTRTSSFRFADLDDLDDLVTTPDAPAALLDGFRAAGVAVHIADPTVDAGAPRPHPDQPTGQG